MAMTATALRNNLFEVLKNTIKYNEIVNVTTKDGSAVIMSEDEYRGLMETLYINSQPGLAAQILEAAAKPIEEGISVEEIEW